MRNFFITGTPRTRTAWLANFLTYGPSFCYHEALLLCDGKPGILPELFYRNGSEYVGTSCSTIQLHPAAIKSLFPQARHVLVIRDFNEVKEELETIFSRELSREMDFMQVTLDYYEKNMSPLIFSYKELDQKDVCECIWNYCVPGVPFNVERWMMLADMNVQLTEVGLDKRRQLCPGI